MGIDRSENLYQTYNHDLLETLIHALRQAADIGSKNLLMHSLHSPNAKYNTPRDIV